MKYHYPSCIVTILLTSLAATAAFVPLSNVRTVAIPSFSSLSPPATTTTRTTGVVLQLRTNNDDGSPQHNDAAAVVSNFLASASICMAALTVAGSASLLSYPANAIDISPNVIVSPSIGLPMATPTTTIATLESQAPSLFNFVKKKQPVAVVYSPKEGTLETTSPNLAKFLNCKLIDEPDVKKVASDSITLVLNNKLIFLTGTVVTITAMYYGSYQYFLYELKEKEP